MATCDVLIVGGGPAGSSCAWQLRAAGLRVLVLDKKPFPRDKTCAGWITPAVMDELQIDGDDYRQGRVLEPITAFATGIIGGSDVITHYDHPISYGIRRCEFDHYLLQRCGATLRLGEPIKTLERRSDRWVVNGEFETRLLVGAGGHFCPVARRLAAIESPRSSTASAIEKNGEAVVAAQEVEFAMSADQLRQCPVPPQTIHLYFCPDLKGYGWFYRKGNFLNVGLGREDSQNLGKHVSTFCDGLRAQGKIPGDVPKQFLGHAYLLYTQSPRPLMDDGVLLVGDAAGLAYPRSGEGIRPAVESGLLAARTIQSARGKYHRANLEPYVQAMTVRFGRRKSTSVTEMFPLAVKRPLARLLLNSPWFARHIIVDRWFLHRHEPPLA
jgi:menaquinone-9 beta-reductase